MKHHSTLDDWSAMDPACLALGTSIVFADLRKRSKAIAERKRREQEEREKAFGRHLEADDVDGIRCFPELVLECESETPMRSTVKYNLLVEEYVGHRKMGLSVKEYKKTLATLKEKEELK